jgi:ssDNA-binding Zn-finger/Zn-ribbon topoisomerase 1
MEIEREIIKLGWYDKHPRKDFCSYVAEKTGELGKEYPSDSAIKYAERVLHVYRRLKTSGGEAMGDPVICPNCHNVVGFKSLTREKVRQIRVTIGKMKLPEIDLSNIETFGFCPWCGHLIRVETERKRGEGSE